MLNKEEQELINKIKDPDFTFEDLKEYMDFNAKKFGYIDHEDFLVKTGWYDRFNN